MQRRASNGDRLIVLEGSVPYHIYSYRMYDIEIVSVSPTYVKKIWHVTRLACTITVILFRLTGDGCD